MDGMPPSGAYLNKSLLVKTILQFLYGGITACNKWLGDNDTRGVLTRQFNAPFNPSSIPKNPVG
jgi:hypothetical protein